MSQKTRMFLTLLISMMLVVAISGCMDEGDDESDDGEEDDTPPPYIPHYENDNVSLEIVKSYTTGTLVGENEDGNFTIGSSALKDYRVVLVRITNTLFSEDQTTQRQIYTDETLIEILDNKEKDGSVIDGKHIEDPDSDERYEIKDFNFTETEGYPSTYGARYMDNGDTIVQAAIALGAPNSFRKVIVGFKIYANGQVQQLQKVSIEI